MTKQIPAGVQRRIYRLIGKASIVLGLAILLVAGGLWGWRQYNRLRGEEEQAALSEFLLLASLTPEPTEMFQVPGSTLTSTPTPTWNPSGLTPSGATLERGTPTVTSAPALAPTPTSMRTPGSTSTPGGGTILTFSSGTDVFHKGNSVLWSLANGNVTI